MKVIVGVPDDLYCAANGRGKVGGSAEPVLRQDRRGVALVRAQHAFETLTRLVAPRQGKHARGFGSPIPKAKGWDEVVFIKVFQCAAHDVQHLLVRIKAARRWMFAVPNGHPAFAAGEPSRREGRLHVMKAPALKGARALCLIGLGIVNRNNNVGALESRGA